MGATVDLYSLGLEVRSDGVAVASDRLKTLAQEGGKAESATNSLASSFANVTSYMQAAAAAMAAWKLTQYIQEAAMLSARVETLAVVMATVAKNAYYSKTQMEGFANGIKKMGITTQEAYSNMTKMTQAGLDLTKSSQLARVAQDAAVIGNINSSEAFARMIQGIRSGETEILRNIGLQVNMEQAYRKYGAQIKKNWSDLSETEKVQARANAVMAEGAKIAGTYEASMTTAGKMMNSLARYFEELKLVVGNVFLPAFTRGVEEMTEALKWANENIKTIILTVKVLGAALATGAVLWKGFLIIQHLEAFMVATYAVAAAARAAAVAEAAEALAMANMGIATVAATVATDAAAVSTTFLGAAIKFMLGPIGIFIGLITAATAALITYWKVQGDALSKGTAGTFADNIAQENIEIREKIRLMKQTDVDKAIEKQQSGQKKLNELKKEAALIDAIIRTNDFEGGDLYGNKAEAAQKKLDKLKSDIANLPALLKENEALVKVQKEEQDKRAPAGKEKKDTREEQSRLEKSLDEARRAQTASFQAYQDTLISDGSKNHIAWINWEVEQGTKTKIEGIRAVQEIEEADLIRKIDANEKLKLSLSKELDANRFYKNGTKEAIAHAQAQDKLNKAWDEGVKLQNQFSGVEQKAGIDDAIEKLRIAEQKLSDEQEYNAEFLERSLDVQIAKAKELKALREGANATFNTNVTTSAGLTGTNAEGGFDSIADKTANALERQADAHKKVTDAIQKQIDLQTALAKNTSDIEKKAALEISIAQHKKTLTLEEQKNAQATTKITNDGYKSQLNEVALYTGMAGQMFSTLASTQDQSSREGFETAKAMNLGAAVMNTASAVMAQIAGADGWTPMAWARMGMAAATGAIQIATIASTSFGGGGSVGSVPSGAFGGGGGGGTTGSGAGGSVSAPLQSTQNSMSAKELDRVADSMDGAAGAMAKASENFLSVSELFKSGIMTMLMNITPGRFTQTSADMSGIGTNISNFLNLDKKSIGAALKGDVVTLWNQTMAGLFGGGWGVSGAGITGQLTGGQFQTGSFVSEHKNGGLFGRSGDRTSYGNNVDAAFAQGMADFFAGIKQDMLIGAKVFGMNAQTTEAGFAGANLPRFQVATAGRKPEDIQKDWEAKVQEASDALAATIPGLTALALGGEHLTDTYGRLANAMVNVNDGLSLIGQRAIVAGGAITDTAYQLEQLFGGADKFATAMEDYLSGGMFTSGEQEALKYAKAQKTVAVGFAELNMKAPETNAEFITLVSSLDVTTASGAATFKSLMDVQQAFADTTKYVKELTQAQKDLYANSISRTLNLTGQEQLATLIELQSSQENELRDAREKGLDTSMLVQVQALEMADAMKKAANTVSEATQKILDATKKALTDTINITLSILNTKKTLLTGPSAMLSPEAAYLQAKSQFEGSDVNNVSANTTAFVEASKNYFASGTGYQQDFKAGLAMLDKFSGTKGDLTDVEKQIQLLEKIAKAVGDNDGVLVKQLSLTWEALQIDTGAATSSLSTAYKALAILLGTPLTLDPVNAASTAASHIVILQAALNTGITGTAAISIKTQIDLLQGVINGTITADLANQMIKLAYDTTQAALDKTIDGTTAAYLINGQALIAQLALNGMINGQQAADAATYQATILQLKLDGLINGQQAADLAVGQSLLLQAIANKILDGATAAAALTAQSAIVQGVADGILNGTSAAYLIANQAVLVQAAASGAINGTTAAEMIQTNAALVQAAIDGSINGSSAVALINYQTSLAQAAIAGGVDGAAAKLTIDANTALINLALTTGVNVGNTPADIATNTGLIQAALTAGIDIGTVPLQITGTTGYGGINEAIQTGISLGNAVTNITGLNGFGAINLALDGGLNTGPLSVSSMLEKFNTALTTSATTTQANLLKFVDALAIVGNYTSQRTSADMNLTKLKEQYTSGAITAGEYGLQVAGIVGPGSTLATTIAAGVTAGLTSLTTPTWGITPADIAARNFTITAAMDAQMKTRAQQAVLDLVSRVSPTTTADWLNSVEGSDLGTKYDLNKDGLLTDSDLSLWLSIQAGTTKWSSLGLPAFATGTPYLNQDGPVYAHQGEIIMDRASSDVLRKYGIPQNGSADNKDSNKALEAKLDALLREVNALRQQQAKEHSEDVETANQNTGKVAIAVGGNAVARVRY